MRSRSERRGESFVPIAAPLTGGRRGSRKRLERLRLRDHTSLGLWILFVLMLLIVLHTVISDATHHRQILTVDDEPRK
jgi:hypothetical protein